MAREERGRKAGLGVVDDELMERYKKDRESAKAKSGGGGSAEWISLKDGLNMVRLLPPLTKGDPFYIYIGQHFSLGESKKGNVYCPRLCISMDGRTRMSDEDCPVCEYVAEVKKLSKKSSEVAAADEIRVSGRWLCQALDVDEDDGKPRFWSMGPMIFNQIMEYLTGKYPMLYQLEGGYTSTSRSPGRGWRPSTRSTRRRTRRTWTRGSSSRCSTSRSTSGSGSSRRRSSSASSTARTRWRSSIAGRRRRRMSAAPPPGAPERRRSPTSPRRVSGVAGGSPSRRRLQLAVDVAGGNRSPTSPRRVLGAGAATSTTTPRSGRWRASATGRAGRAAGASRSPSLVVAGVGRE